jgi:DNA polymerase-3 subunit beta
MKFEISRESLLGPLQQVVGVVEKRHTLPILANVLLRMEDGRIQLTGTDLEVQLVTQAQAEGDTTGAVTVPARKLLDICRLLSDRSVLSVECRNDRFNIRCDGSRFSLSTLPADHYPQFEAGAPELEIELPAATLQKAFAKTTFAMAQQDVRYYLNGLLLEFDNNVLRTVASDGHRLAIFQEALDKDLATVRQIIVPRKGILEFARLLGDSDAEVVIAISPNNVRVSLGHVQFFAKLIEGRFPDYQRVIPQELTRRVRVDKNLLKGALNRVAVLSNEKFKSISLEIASGAVMVLKAHNPDHEEAEEQIAVELDGEGLATGFNALYLLDALNNIDSDEVRLSFPENVASCLIEDSSDDRFRFIVMPMRL